MRYIKMLLFNIFFSATIFCQKPVYNPLIAKRNLEISASTYCPNLSDWNCSHCVQDIELYHVITGDTNIAIMRDNIQNSTVFGFRGTSNIENWVSDLKAEFIQPYSNQNIKVHKGLYTEYMLYKDILFQYIDINDKITLTGHSAGGALGMLFAYDIYNTNSIKDLSVYTFGKPRIGNQAFAESAKNITHYRITHAKDIVPHVPEEILGYFHTNTEVWYYNDNDYKICVDSEDITCSNSCAPVHCVSIEDHMKYMDTMIGSDSC